MSEALDAKPVPKPAVAPRAVSGSVWLVCILLLAVAVRLYDLDALSLWRDELFSRFYPRAGEAFMWGPGRSLEPNPPLYYSILHGWMAVAGESDAAVRLPSVVASVITVWLAYLIGRELAGERTGLVAALMLALSATSVFYAQEARSYALEGSGIGVALLGIIRFLRRPGAWQGLALYALGGSLALYSHMTAVLFVAAANLAVAAGLLGSRPLLAGRGLLRWCAANVMVVAMCLPLLAIVLSSQVKGAYAWIDPLDAETVLLELSCILVGPAAWGLGLSFAAAALAACAVLVAVCRWRPDRVMLMMLVMIPCLFMAMLIGVSIWRPMLMLRTVSWLVLPVALVLGAMLAPRSKAMTIGVTGVLFVALLFQLVRHDTLKEDWRGFLRSLDPRLGPPALVVLAPDMAPAAVTAYAPQVRTIHQIPGDEPGSVDATVIPRLLGVRPISLAEVVAAVKAEEPVWLIVRYEAGDWMKRALSLLPPPKERVDPPVRGDPATAFRW